MKVATKLLGLLIVLAWLIGCAPTAALPTSAPPTAASQPSQPTAAAAATTAPEVTTAPAATTAPASGEVSRADTLIIGTPEDPVNLDPATLFSLTTDSIFNSVFDRLEWRSEPDMQPALWLAESVSHTEPLIWQVKLKPGIKFHNGEPLNAAAVKYAMERLPTIKGADMFYYNQAAIDHLEVVDDLTVNIHTKEPVQLLPFSIANGFYIVEPKYYSSTPEETLATKPIGTGPYKLVEYVPDDHVTLERNEEYWGDKPAFARVIWRVIPETATRLAELEAGNIDMATKVPFDQQSTVENMPNAVAIPKATGRRVYVQMVQEPDSPLANPKVRQAMNYAVDVDTIINTLLAGSTKRMATFPNPPNADPDLKPYAFDPEKAKALLKEAGYENGFKVDFWTGNGRLTNDVKIVQAIADYLAAVGIEANVQVLDNTVYKSRAFACQLPGLYLRSEGPEFSDAYDLQGIAPKYVAETACGKWANEDWNKMYDQLRAETDQAKRRELSLKLQQTFYDQVPILMLYNEPDLYGVSKNITFTPRIDQRIYVARIGKANQ